MDSTAFAAASHVSEPYFAPEHLQALQQRVTLPLDAPLLGSGSHFEHQHRPSFEQHGQPSGSLSNSFSEAPLGLGASFQPPQLSTGFEAPLRPSFDAQPSPPPHSSIEQRSSFEQHGAAFGDQQQQPAPELGYLGSPTRGLVPSGGGPRSRAVGSPTARSAVGSPIPGSRQRQLSPGPDTLVGSPPPRDQPSHINGSMVSGSGEAGAVDACKLVILGLPWDTSEETLQEYFAHFGPIQEAVIMKDRYTGKSRGFGFVTFANADDASCVVTAEHHIDGRRCEAKLALPRGGANPNRTTRIFVARILPAVSEDAFRAHFEHFGVVQDAYMPKDASKLGHRGIGFVTFASPDSVEKVMADTHVLCGQELAIDRATPKDRSPPPGMGSARNGGASTGTSGGGMNGNAFGYVAAANPYAMAAGLGVSPGALSTAAGAAALRPTANGMADPNQLAAAMLAGGFDMDALLGAGGFGATGSSNNMQALQNLPGVLGPDFAGAMPHMQPPYNPAPPQPPHRGGGRSSRHSADMTRSGSPSRDAGEHPGRRGSADTGGRALSPSQSGGNSAMSHGGGGSVTSGLDANAGPRIFVGKLNRATTEADVREYFTRFGYVLDVYMPRDKHNRHEHRGFGFVTFETEAAVQRVAAHGLHQIRGAAVAIDSAVPRREDVGSPAPMGDVAYPGLAAAMNIIDLAARGDAGPLRHLHGGGGNGVQRYRPYNHAGGPDMMPGGY